jgi:hypothetical protein
MISFKEYYHILNEGVLNSVPRDLLGMETSYENFPIKAPYGFWVDRSGNWITVPYIGHSPTALGIIRKANKYLVEKGMERVEDYSPYKPLYSEGWMRVQLTTGTVFYEFKPANQIATTPQNRFLEMCKEMYNIPNAENDSD